ncbi:flagellar biosynthetic protein FliO [Gynuella sunshinyii]|uniref:Flagellar protein n=1 Tax=Gynuella sunshinyii YC6258 TaxID=1445510 RepID=A0A0C5VAH0_9GAMM|nr:flagellar biosynthetic protein FliO [Gynuella sunshinyii]AJQ96315.1 flagellar biogenesis protein [Gynuella sunshinyii YC6258]
MNTTAPAIDLSGMAIALIFIIGLIFACAWFVRRISGGVSFNNRQIKIITAVSLGTKEKLILIEAGGKQMLLGVTQHQINLLKEFDEPLDTSASEAGTPTFSDRLKQVLKGSDQWKNTSDDTFKD